jgi:Protein of unknown function (DUF3631)
VRRPTVQSVPDSIICDTPGKRQEAPDDAIRKETAALLDALYQRLKWYIWFPDSTRKSSRDLLCPYILHTHVLEASETTPYPCIVTPGEDCGKTRLLEFLQQFVRNSELVSSITPAAIFRMLNVSPELLPTFLIDEAQRTFSSNAGNDTEQRTLAAVVDSGYRRGAYVRRVNKNTQKSEAWPTFGPRVLASIGTDVFHRTTRSRMIIVRLIPKPPAAEGELKRWNARAVRKDATELRERIAAWREAALPYLMAQAEDEEYVPQMPPHVQPGDREEELWWPLMQIAELAGPEWTDWVLRAAVALKESDETERTDYTLLVHVRHAFDDLTAKKLPSARLVQYLTTMPKEQRWRNKWGFWTDIDGNDVTMTSIGRDLRKVFDLYGIRKSHSVRIEDKTWTGYERTDFEEAWRSVPAHLFSREEVPAS